MRLLTMLFDFIDHLSEAELVEVEKRIAIRRELLAKGKAS